MTVVACSPSTITRGEVQFNYSEFTTAYPEFAVAPAANSAACAMNFALASLNLENCCGSPVQDANVRQALLYLLTAHVTFLFTPCGANNSSPQGIVGRIDSATEGSVSVHADFPQPSDGSLAFLSQTKYGAQFIALTASLRTMHYIPAPHMNGGPLGALDTGYGPGWDNGGWQ